METEQDKFMRQAYSRTVAAARKAFGSWHSRKREDAVQETLTKMLDQWFRLKARGGRPEEIIGGLIRYAILFVKYDRRVSGRARHPDVYDYRSPLKKQGLDGQGAASPGDRSDARNGWIDWQVAGGEEPSEVAMALEATGLSVAEYYAA